MKTTHDLPSPRMIRRHIATRSGSDMAAIMAHLGPSSHSPTARYSARTAAEECGGEPASAAVLRRNCQVEPAAQGQDIGAVTGIAGVGIPELDGPLRGDAV